MPYNYNIDAYTEGNIVLIIKILKNENLIIKLILIKIQLYK